MKRLFPVVALFLLTSALPALASNPGRPGGTVPEVYVAAGNSFIITVPSLTKVAIGDPRVVAATVVSPTEVLVQANPGIENNNGAINIATSDLFVWSGDRRYVYRVVSVETSDSGFLRAHNMARIEVDPDKLVVYMYIDESTDRGELERTNTGLLAMKALGLRYEIRIMRISTGLTSGGLDSDMVGQAIDRAAVMTGMTEEELIRSQGDLPPIYRTVISDGSIVDYYVYPSYYVGIANHRVVYAWRTEEIPEAIVRQAIVAHIVMVGMTETQVIEAVGTPPSAPVTRIVDGVAFHDYIYPERTVTLTGGHVANVLSNNPALLNGVEKEYEPLGALQDPTVGYIEGRAYRLRYISGAELQSEVTQVLGSLFRAAPYNRGSRTEGLYTIYADTNTLYIVDNLIRVLDRPDQRTPVTVQRAQYSVGGVTTGFLTARFAPSISTQRIRSAVDVLQRTVQSLPAVSGAPPAAISLSGRTLTMTGVPEQVAMVDSMLTTILPDLIGQEIATAVRQGEVLVGMTRRNVEVALGVRLDTGAWRRVNDASEIVSSYMLKDRVVSFVEDLLVENSLFPNADEERNAVADRKVLSLMPRSRVETILGEQARRVTGASDGTIEVEYAFGKALYWNGRLVRMSELYATEMRRRGITVLAPFNAEQEFQLLSVEEQQMVMRRGTVMKGMTERDVSRAVGESPYSIRPGEYANEKFYTYSNYTVLFRDGLAVRVDQTTSGAPRIITLKSRGATDIVSMILGSFANAAQMSITADTVSNRLIVRASNEQFADVERFALAMDQQEVPQVLIEAKFVQMSRATSRQLGVQWGLSTQADAGNRPFAGFAGTTSRTDATQPTTNLTTGVNGEVPDVTQRINQGADGGLILGMLGGNGFSFGGLRYTSVDVMLAAMESKGDIDVLSSPRIATINGQAARLEAINRVYDITTSQTIEPTSGITSFVVTPTERRVGITLDVTPTIGQDGIVTMDITATSSNLSGPPLNFSAGGNVIIINQISERNSKTRVMVRSGTPLVMGGLSTRRVTNDDRRVPGLGSLPIIGRFFRAESKSADDADLLIFLTARIVPPDGGMSAVDRIVGGVRSDIPNPVPSYAIPPASPNGATSIAPAAQ